MSKCCVLCQRELFPGENDTIPVGIRYQPVCPACKGQYDRSPLAERQRLRRKAELYLDSLPKEEIPPVPPCSVCGAAMERKLSHLRLGADGMSALSVLMADQYSVDLYACPKCGKVELYTAGVQPEDKP